MVMCVIWVINGLYHQITIFIGGMVTILSHGCFMTLFYPHYIPMNDIPFRSHFWCPVYLHSSCWKIHGGCPIFSLHPQVISWVFSNEQSTVQPDCYFWGCRMCKIQARHCSIAKGKKGYSHGFWYSNDIPMIFRKKTYDREMIKIKLVHWDNLPQSWYNA